MAVNHILGHECFHDLDLGGVVVTEPAAIASPKVAFLVTLMSFAPLGVPFETLFIGGCCYFAGACCRTGTILGKALEGGTDPHIGRYLLALAFAIPAAAVASMLIFFAANMLGIHADIGCGGILLLTGIKGTDGIPAIVNMVSGIFGRVFGGSSSGPKP